MVYKNQAFSKEWLFQQRRVERHRRIYTWKILEGIGQNCGLEVNINDYKKRVAKVSAVRRQSAVKTKFSVQWTWTLKLFPQMYKKYPQRIKRSIQRKTYRRSLNTQIKKVSSIHFLLSHAVCLINLFVKLGTKIVFG